MRRGLRITDALGEMLFRFALLMLVPIPVAFVYDPWDVRLLGVPFPVTAPVFLLAALVTAASGQAMRIAGQAGRDQELQEKDAYLAVALGWLLLVAFAALPLLWQVGRPTDAWFEAMSGLTATGATILADIEAAAPSMLFWRGLLQFVAGLGIVVVGVALLSRLTHGGSQLLAADVTGSSGRLRPKLKEVARALWRIYAAFSIVLVVAYTLAMRFHAGLGWRQAAYDAAIHTFSTISTGGFSNHTQSIAYYQSWLVEGIAVVFMLAAGTSFALHVVSEGRPGRIARDTEWRFYAAVVALSALATSGLLVAAGGAVATSVREAAFTVASIATSTGYATVDHDTWPPIGRAILLVLMFTGAMAGSTSGGIKMLRVLLLLKVARREIRKLMHPRAVIAVRHNGKPVKEQALLTVIAFFFAYITVWLGATVWIVGTDPALDMLDGAAAAAAAIGNTGPAMGSVGPHDHYGGLLPSTKLVLSGLMWVGRVEVFSAILVLSPSSWRN